MEFQGRTYKENLLRELRETDDNPIAPLTDWFGQSKVGEYTPFYSYYVFHAANGFWACYANDTNNCWQV